MYTIDTNALIYYAASEEAVLVWFKRALDQNAPLHLPTIVITEFLSYPALTKDHRAFFASLLFQLHVIPLSLEIATHAADLRRIHRMKLADSVVAATALIANSTLVTRNIEDFRKVKHLLLQPI